MKPEQKSRPGGPSTGVPLVRGAELAHFFKTMGRYFAQGEPESSSLFAEHPGWDASPGRVEIYGSFVAGHVRDVLDKLYPLSRAAVGEPRWDFLTGAYVATRPARHFEMNSLGEGFPSFLGDHVSALELPSHLPALARFEWTDFAVYASRDELPAEVEALTANPTLVPLELGFSICAHVRDGAPVEARPELALLWRHPVTEKTLFLAADERALLVLKMALEGLTPEAVAASGGLPLDEVNRQVSLFAADGMVLVPKARR
jgi:hypothetical protein